MTTLLGLTPIGWSTKPTLAQDLVLDALLMAVRRRKPKHTLIHSDQGSQFGSDAWRRFCHAHHLEPSMSRRGNCWDNTVAESFFSSLQKERIKKRIYKTREIATAEIDEHVELFYNCTRQHSHLSGVSPEAFEPMPKWLCAGSGHQPYVVSPRCSTRASIRDR